MLWCSRTLLVWAYVRAKGTSSCVGREKVYGLVDIRQVVPIRYEEEDDDDNNGAVGVIFQKILSLKVQVCCVAFNME